MKIEIPNGVSELQIKFKKQPSLSDFLNEIHLECDKQPTCLLCPYRVGYGNDADGYGCLFAGRDCPDGWDKSAIKELVKAYESRNADD